MIQLDLSCNSLFDPQGTCICLPKVPYHDHKLTTNQPFLVPFPTSEPSTTTYLQLAQSCTMLHGLSFDRDFRSKFRVLRLLHDEYPQPPKVLFQVL